MTKQQTNDKGRVLPTREVVDSELRALDKAMVSIPYLDDDLELIQIPMKDLNKYIMEKLNEQYYAALRFGIELGRKEMVVAMETVIEEDDKPNHTTGEYDDYHMCETCDRVLGDDSDYDSKCLCEHRNGLRAEQRQRLKALVGAVERDRIALLGGKNGGLEEVKDGK